MAELYGMDRHNTTFPQVASPILIGVFVIYPVLKVIGQKVLQFNWCTEFEVDFWEFPVFVYETTNRCKSELNRLTW
jgi:hypothetical protein